MCVCVCVCVCMCVMYVLCVCYVCVCVMCVCVLCVYVVCVLGVCVMCVGSVCGMCVLCVCYVWVCVCMLCVGMCMLCVCYVCVMCGYVSRVCVGYQVCMCDVVYVHRNEISTPSPWSLPFPSITVTVRGTVYSLRPVFKELAVSWKVLVGFRAMLPWNPTITVYLMADVIAKRKVLSAVTGVYNEGSNEE